MPDLLKPRVTLSKPSSRRGSVDNLSFTGANVSSNSSEQTQTSQTVQPSPEAQLDWRLDDDLSAPAITTDTAFTKAMGDNRTLTFRAGQHSGTLVATALAQRSRDRSIAKAMMKEQLKRLKDDIAERLRLLLWKMDPVRKANDLRMEHVEEQGRELEEANRKLELIDQAFVQSELQAANARLCHEKHYQEVQVYRRKMKALVSELKDYGSADEFGIDDTKRFELQTLESGI
ncbi:hypothetical protein QFC21_003806 [Naganishia friedmannii]|uniref:Uncharacterized protein n=1 Tax=Naganishia friedmannii TaxID=89922 RepID=A0ACC2VLL0_9TREE|nr:hypothetical protein QFC21_003806 [Naganishia friedmannii]